MDYSVNGILTTLQDLQREYIGRVSVYVDTLILDNGDYMVACCVFDKSGEPHTKGFYSYQSDEERKENLVSVLKRIKDAL